MRELNAREEATMRVINSNPHGTMNHLGNNAVPATFRYGRPLFGPRTFLRTVFDIIRKEEGEFTATSLRKKHGEIRTVRAWQTAITRLKNLYYIDWRLVHPDKPEKPYRVYSRNHRAYE
jgi:hypothetical protein